MLMSGWIAASVSLLRTLGVTRILPDSIPCRSMRLPSREDWKAGTIAV